MVETDAFTELRLPVCKRTGRSASDDRNAPQQSAHKMPHGLGRTEIANQTGCFIIESCTDELCCEPSGCLGVWSGGLPCPSSLALPAFPNRTLLASFASRMVIACKECYTTTRTLWLRGALKDRHCAILSLALQRRPWRTKSMHSGPMPKFLDFNQFAS